MLINLQNPHKMSWEDCTDEFHNAVLAQEKAGATIERLIPLNDEWVSHGRKSHYTDHGVYRVRAGTVMSVVPDDELNLFNLTKPFGLLHSSTQQALKDHPHGYEVFNGLWSRCSNPNWRHELAYRAKRQEPREFWIELNSDGSVCATHLKERKVWNGTNVVHVREVI